ncbi:hypothetical protein GGI1_19474, partial [Acidithiobacillus sp. GGI-221]
CTDAGDLIRVSRLEWCEVTGKERGGAIDRLPFNA